jgi:hypothetical protein
MLNGAQIVNSRAVVNTSGGYLFENTGPSEALPGVSIIGAIAEWNVGPGMHFKGYHAVLEAPYFEGNGTNGTDFDLTLSSNIDGTVASELQLNSPYFGPLGFAGKGTRIAGGTGSTQRLTVLNFKSNSTDVIDLSKIQLTAVGMRPDKMKINQGTGSFTPSIQNPGYGLAGSMPLFSTSPWNTGIPATGPSTIGGGVLMVLGSRGSSPGAAVAQYLLRRNEDGTVTPTLVAGTDFLTFAVSGGTITVATAAAPTSVSIYGH